MGELIGAGLGLVDDLWTTDEERKTLEAQGKLADARLAEAKAASDVARIRAEQTQRLALIGLGAAGLIAFSFVAVQALKD
jgi:hypothetical protein